MLSFSSIGTRVRLIVFFNASAPLNFLRLQNFAAVRPSGRPVRRHGEAVVKQETADCMEPRTPNGVFAAVGADRRHDRLRIFPPPGEFRPVMQHENRACRRLKSPARRVEMASQNLMLAEAIVRKEPIRCFRRRPILAGARDRFAYGHAHLREQVTQSALQPRIRQATARQFPIEPPMRRPLQARLLKLGRLEKNHAFGGSGNRPSSAHMSRPSGEKSRGPATI